MMSIRLPLLLVMCLGATLSLGVFAQTSTTKSARGTSARPAQPESRSASQPSSAQTAAANSAFEMAKKSGALADPEPIITRRQIDSFIEPEVAAGYKALQQNNFSQARQAYSQVLARQPTQRDALLGISYAHYALGENAQAISTLRRLLELYPRDSDAVSALFLISGADAVEQESRIKQMLDRNDRAAPLHYALGVLYFDQGRFNESERAFDKAVSMEPEQPDYVFNHALSLDRLGRHKEAMRQYINALNIANQSSAVFSRDLVRARLRALNTAAAATPSASIR